MRTWSHWRPGVGWLLLIALAIGGATAPVGAASRDHVAVLISFPQTPGAAEHALVRAAGGQVQRSFHLVPAVAATLPAQSIAALRAHPGISAIELDGEATAQDHGGTLSTPEIERSWGVEHIGADHVQQAGGRGAGVKVAVLDAGVDRTHPQLADAYAGGFDFIDNDDDPTPSGGCDHGTHVAGILAAAADDVGVVGTAPGVALYSVRVLRRTSSGGCSGPWSGIIAGLEWSVDNEMQITNHSYGSASNPGGIVRAAYEAAAAAGVLQIASAGNAGNSAGTGNSVGYPARWEAVVAVANTEADDSRRWSSSTGAAVELAAPGTAIYSTLLDGGYGSKTGTSMAAPHVTGVAAMVWGAGAADANGDGTTAAEVRLRLHQTVQDLGAAGRDAHFGYGLVQAQAAVGSGAGPPPPPANVAPQVAITGPADGSSVSDGTLVTLSGTASDAEDGNLSGALEWFSDRDSELGSGATRALTNLSVGVHQITATVTDSDGLGDSDAITLTITAAPPPGGGSTVHVGDLDDASVKLAKGRWQGVVWVRLEDASHAPVANATIQGTFTQNGQTQTKSCQTGTTDTCSLTWDMPAKGGNGRFTVDAVSGPGTYAPAANHDVEGDSDGTTIALSK